jgi:predicted membrane protein
VTFKDKTCCPPNCRSGRRGIGTAVLGLGALSAGIILTLDNLGVIDGEEYLSYWPVLVILVGISHLVRPVGSRRVTAGLIWMAVGGILLGSNLGYITFDVWDLWPLLLVIIGGSLILKPFRRLKTTTGEGADVFEGTAILGGVHRRVASEDFKGGDAVAIMGGCEIDLRDSSSAGGPAEINTFAFWGGVEIRVPQDWEVQVKAAAILGAIEDKTRTVEGDGKKVLIVSGMAIMGAVEISN